MPRRAWHTPGAIGPRVKAIRNALAAGADDDDADARPTPLPLLQNQQQQQPFAKQRRDVGTHLLTSGYDEEGLVRGRRRRREGGGRAKERKRANDSCWTLSLSLSLLPVWSFACSSSSSSHTLRHGHSLAFVGPARQLHISCESIFNSPFPNNSIHTLTFFPLPSYPPTYLLSGLCVTMVVVYLKDLLVGTV